MNKPILAAKKLLLCGVIAISTVYPAQAGIPVFDGSNLSQNVLSTIENIAQTLKQIEEYQTQLKQYENMITNTLAPAAYIWDKAQNTMSLLVNATNRLRNLQNSIGGIDAYLARFGDVNYYRTSPCFKNSGCTAAEFEAIKAKNRLSSKAMKDSIDDLFKALDSQNTSIDNDAAKLVQLQSAAQGAQGQLQALGFANQLASHQSNQLLQMRAMLMAQQQATASLMQAEADKAAQQQAASENLHRGTFTPSPVVVW